MRAPKASYFDGKTTQRHDVTLDFTEQALVLEEDGVQIAQWPYADIRQEDADDEVMRLTSIGAPELARIEITDKGSIAEIEDRCTALLSRHRNDRRQRRHIVLWAMAAALSLVAITLWLMPYLAAELAPLVPRPIERRIGDAVYRQALNIFGVEGTCEGGGKNGAPLRALETLADKLRGANGLDTGDLTLVVIKSKVPNAFALPGKRIVILDGILQASETPDEIAGVLAHEMGHIAHHDGMRTLIESGGMGFVLGTVLGDFAGATAIFFAGKALVQASFSREVEAAADTYAIETMRVLGRSPVPLGNLLVRLSASSSAGGSQPSLLDSHPATPDRLAAMKLSRVLNTGLPILSEIEFKALKLICID
ncbi:Peptidase family M48 [Rhizobiales bacterium GAS191]|jgi:Zn-dependent protease with chaperone function|nr:Peptidase family M48 [Rhizobiales bacterium GAS113]SEC65224.1 Peptidase family M48 [Rhizobiales bacterium GAS191]